MKSAPNRENLEIIWELTDDPDAQLHVRRAIELILAEALGDRAGGFDNALPTSHDEEVPVGNDKQIQPNQ